MMQPDNIESAGTGAGKSANYSTCSAKEVMARKQWLEKKLL
jgi:hypothetical protein